MWESSVLICLLYTGCLEKEFNIFKMLKKTNLVHVGVFCIDMFALYRLSTKRI